MRLLAVALGAVALSGCGAQQATVVKRAFERDIASADVTFAVSMSSKDGETALGLSELISAGNDAFVVYQDETYQFGRDQLAQLRLGGASPSSTDITKLMSRMRDWFPESDTQSDATLNGEPVIRFTGKLDLSEALKDMKDLAKQPGASGFEGLKQLSGAELAQIAKTVSDPRFTVDIAKADGKLRRIAARMKVAGSGTMSFSLQLKNVDKPVSITAPATGKPIAELIQRLQHDVGGSRGGEFAPESPAS